MSGKKSKGKKTDKVKKPKKVKAAQVPSGEFTPTTAPGPSGPAEATGPDPLLPLDRAAKQDAEVAAQWAHRARIDYHLESPAPVEDEPERPEATSGKDVPSPPAAPGIEKPSDPVLENGNGQPVIHYRDPVTGAEKVKGYTRVTTYIDGLDDKTTLNKWKQRTLLEGAALDFAQDATGDGGSIASIGRAVKRLDEALADIDRRELVDGELLELRRQEVLKEHRTFLESIAENLMDLGGAHDKATKGTDLHRLTELVDAGQPLPDDTSASDRRDVEAYRAKMDELGIQVLWAERRVVLDDIQVSGTMDRAYLVKLPGMARRSRVVGDLKTGSVSYSAAKIGMQLALYARGLGYDWTKPLEREPLRLSKAHGLLVHLPQGEGVCEVYVVDLELAAKGLEVARQVREWRNTGRRVYDLRKPLRGNLDTPPRQAEEG